MTEAEANIRLKTMEKEYFNCNTEYETTYAAVVKKTLDLEKKDDYFIEIGLTDFSVLTDPEFNSKNIKNQNKFLKYQFNETVFNDYLKEDVIPVDSGKVRLLSNKKRETLKKITGGCSVFYKSSNVGSGTAGAFFKLKSSDDIFMISNRHVIVDNDFELDTEIVHPSYADTIRVKDYDNVIGTVFWTSSLKDDKLDAAIARIDYPVDIGKYCIDNKLNFNSIDFPKIFDNVKKYGRSSGLTFGEVRSVNATVNVTENIKNPKFFRNQILTTHLSKDGDSGSVLINKNNDIIGLVFADNDGTASFSNNIQYIFKIRNHIFSIDNFLKFI